MKKPTDNPLVSIITPLYNAAQFVAQTIASIQSQTYDHWEHIIVDDCSSDGSLALVQSLASQDGRIKVITLPKNSGAARARNVATETAQGAYIAFLDSDDLWHPEKLEKQIAFMKRQDCDVSYTNYLHIDEVGEHTGTRIIAMPRLTYTKQHANNYVGNLTGVYNVEILGKIVAPNIRKRQDWAVWLEAIKKSGKPALGLQEDLAYYRIRKDSISADKLNLVKYNYLFYREYLEYSRIKSWYSLGLFFLEYFAVRPKWIEHYER